MWAKRPGPSAAVRRTDFETNGYPASSRLSMCLDRLDRDAFHASQQQPGHSGKSGNNDHRDDDDGGAHRPNTLSEPMTD